ncbi:MAG: energy-coupling factor transporter ATPase [Clostridia bacterium]|nr:energy-coupling factor transporter ATPase [Oscillospiraceae bacterium]MBQ7005227.1 energy-coupling factor transporter ATPase [Clostridia bacterium]
MSVTVLETENLSHVYSKGTTSQVHAIRDISLKIEKGELVGIIGHTGSGKSTLIQHFNGLLKGSSGTVLLDGKDIWSDKKNIRNVRFRVGICFQYPEYQLFEETVYKDIAYGPKNMKLSDEETDKRVRQVLSFVGLDESYLEKSPFDLSGGEKRRVAIAGVMAMEPEVLILDEPCAGLDPKGRETVLSLITSYREKTGSTVLVVSHSMEDISKIASKVLVMNNSQLAYYDTVDGVFTHSSELYDMGLNVPQLTRLFLKLREKGYDVPTDVYTLEKAGSELLRLLGKGDIR